MSDQYPPLLSEKGHPKANIALLPEVYEALIKVALEQAPAESFGALIGQSSKSGRFGSVGTKEVSWGVIEGIVPVKLVAVQTGQAPDMEEWDALAERLAGEHSQRILGWFYADPAIGIFKPRINILQIADMLKKSGYLLLMVNPVSKQGAFYVSRGDHFVNTGGFHEVLPEQGAEPVIPWNGEVQGAEEWLKSSYETYGYSAWNIIEGYTFFDEEDDNWPGGTPPASGSAPPDAASPISQDTEAPRPEGHLPYSALNKEELSSKTALSDHSPDPAVYADARNGEPANATGVAEHSGPATEPLSPLEDNAIRFAPTSMNGAGPDDQSPASEPVVRAKRRWWLSALGLVLGTAVVVVFAGSYMLQPTAGTLPSPDPTPTMPNEGEVPRTATALALLAAPTPTETPSSTPAAVATRTATRVPSATPTTVPATSTDLPTSTITTERTATETATQIPTQTALPVSTPTSVAPSATPTAVNTRRVVVTYIVRSGDTLDGIAARFGVTVSAIMRANNMTSTFIRAGQTLIIP